jgi:hypothetical protein
LVLVVMCGTSRRHSEAREVEKYLYFNWDFILCICRALACIFLISCTRVDQWREN